MGKKYIYIYKRLIFFQFSSDSNRILKDRINHGLFIAKRTIRNILMQGRTKFEYYFIHNIQISLKKRHKNVANGS